MGDNHRLLSTIFELKKELKIAKTELESMAKSVRMMNSSTDDLNKILSFGKKSFGQEWWQLFSIKKNNEFRGESSLSKVFVLVKHVQISSHDYNQKGLCVEPVQHKSQKRWICHFYRSVGHIHPYYFQLHGSHSYPRLHKLSFKAHNFARHVRSLGSNKLEWKVKNSDESSSSKCQVAFTTLRMSTQKDWYFNSGSSHHMTVTNPLYQTFNHAILVMQCLVMVLKEK